MRALSVHLREGLTADIAIAVLRESFGLVLREVSQLGPPQPVLGRLPRVTVHSIQSQLSREGYQTLLRNGAGVVQPEFNLRRGKTGINGYENEAAPRYAKIAFHIPIIV